MFKFIKQVSNYAKETVQAARYIGQGLSVTFDHMRRRPITWQGRWWRWSELCLTVYGKSLMSGFTARRELQSLPQLWLALS